MLKLERMVSEQSVDQAILLLAEFPAEPVADSPGAGMDVLLDPNRVREARSSLGTDVRKTTDTTVLFVSDTHLGYENRTKTGRGSTVPWIGEITSRTTFTRIREIAIAQDVDAVIHTGDILDHEVDEIALDAAESSLSTLSQLGIPFYCIIGSHDHVSHEPQHKGSVDGIAWIREQVNKGHFTELTVSPTPIAGGPLNAYGISAHDVGIDDVGTYQNRGWSPSEIAFGPTSSGPNVLCLHESATPYRTDNADIDLDRLLAQSRVSFDCVLIGDEHGPVDEDFESGYTFETTNGTPVFYTGPAIRLSYDYQDEVPFVTELTFTGGKIIQTRHTL